MAKNKNKNKKANADANTNPNANSNNSNLTKVKAKAKKASTETKENHASKMDSRPQINAPAYKRVKVNNFMVPRLVPTVTVSYNINKKMFAELSLKELSHSIYHVWLNSLYVCNFDQTTIFSTLSKVVKAADIKAILPLRNVFINVLKDEAEFGRQRVAGSCFVLIPKSIIYEDIEKRITDHKLHMVRVNMLYLREYFKEGRTLIFSEAYADFLSTVPPMYLDASRPKSPGSENSRGNNREPPGQPVNSSGPGSREQPPTAIPKTEKVVTKGPTPAIGAVECIPSTSRGIRHEPSSSPEIVKVVSANGKNEHSPVAKPRRVPFSNSSFIPVTQETLGTAIELMKQYENEKRTVAIVFDTNFLLSNIDMNIIREIFSPMFGTIKAAQVLIRANAPRLAKNLEEAQKDTFTVLNHAYIVAAPGVTLNELNRRSAARGTFCCPMTLGGVIKNLTKGSFLMHRSVLLNQQKAAPRPISEDNQPDSEESDEQGDQGKHAQPKLAAKRNRIAASLDGNEDSAEVTCPGKIDAQLWQTISKCGNSVIKIENLPDKLTVDTLNLMMGTSSLRVDQIVAANKTRSGRTDLMDIRVVLNDKNPDVQSILSKNHYKLPNECDVTLLIKRTHHGELRNFMSENANSLRRLNITDKRSINSIGYGKTQRFY